MLASGHLDCDFLSQSSGVHLDLILVWSCCSLPVQVETSAHLSLLLIPSPLVGDAVHPWKDFGGGGQVGRPTLLVYPVELGPSFPVSVVSLGG